MTALIVGKAYLYGLMFLSTAAWFSNPWIGVAAILAGGHVPVALVTRRTLRPAP